MKGSKHNRFLLFYNMMNVHTSIALLFILLTGGIYKYSSISILFYLNIEVVNCLMCFFLGNSLDCYFCYWSSDQQWRCQMSTCVNSSEVCGSVKAVEYISKCSFIFNFYFPEILGKACS